MFVYTKLIESTDYYVEIADIRVFSTKESAQSFMRKDYEQAFAEAKANGETYDDAQIEDIGEPYISDWSAFLPTGCASNQQRTSWEIVICEVEP